MSASDSTIRTHSGLQSSYSSRWDHPLPQRLLDSISNDGSMSVLTCRCGQRVPGGSRSNSDPGCSHEVTPDHETSRCHAAREGPCNASQGSMPRVPNRRTILGPHQAMFRPPSEEHMNLLTCLWLLTYHVFYLWRRTRTRYQPSCGGRRNEKCLSECPTIDGFRGSGTPRMRIPVPRGAKPVFTVAFSYPRPNG